MGLLQQDGYFGHYDSDNISYFTGFGIAQCCWISCVFISASELSYSIILKYQIWQPKSSQIAKYLNINHGFSVHIRASTLQVLEPRYKEIIKYQT